MTFGNFFEYHATGGHPHEGSWWVHLIVWPVIVLAFILARPNNG